MSLYQAIGETGLNEVLAKRLTTPGGATAPAVAPEFFPVITMENDRPEWGYIKGEYPYARAVVLGASVSSNHAILRNPAGSKTICVVHRVTALCSAGSLALYLAPIGNLAAGIAQGGLIPRDGRQSLISGGVYTRQSVSTLNTLDAAAPAFTQIYRSVATSIDLELPFILTPGNDLAVVATTVAATLTCSFATTERSAQPGELV